MDTPRKSKNARTGPDFRIRGGVRPEASRLLAITWACALSLLIVSCSKPVADAPDADKKASTGQSATTPTTTTEPATPESLAELPAAVARLERLQHQVNEALVVDEEEQTTASQLTAVVEGLAVSQQRLELLPIDELTERLRRLATADRSITITGGIVTSRLERVDKASRRVGELKTVFSGFGDLSKAFQAPQVIQRRVAASQLELSELSQRLTTRRTEVLTLVDRVAEAKGAMAAMKALTESRLMESRRELSAFSEGPIWSLPFSGRQAWATTTQRVIRAAGRVGEWFRPRTVRVITLFAVFFGVTFFLSYGQRPGALPGSDGQWARGGASPWAAGLLAGVVGTIALSSDVPLIVFDLGWMLAAPAAAVVIVRMLGPNAVRTVWVLAASLALAPLEAIMRDLPLGQRIVLLLQTVPLAVTLALDLRQRRVAGQWLSPRTWMFMRGLLTLLALCLVAAGAGSVFGWVSLAWILCAGALGTLGALVVAIAGYLVVEALLRSYLAPRPDHGLRMVRTNPAVVLQTCLGVLRFLVCIEVAFVSIRAFGLEVTLKDRLFALLTAELTAGAISISTGAIVGFVVVLVISVLLSRLIGFFLVAEIFPRFEVRKGLAYAISGMARYLVLVVGVVFAGGVSGIDLTTFGFVAGALGVGIGFGLQSIVNNFISGLVLLFERPIQVGDTVDVSGATGTVMGIGIRASTVRTFEGSEVIVPNADLISKPVTNWTRSSVDRRYDVSVRVSYGSPLEATAQALLAAAKRTPGVGSIPEPEALLQKFGESSLDWFLRVWMRAADSPQVLSNLKRAVSEELAAAGISVPFSQRVVHFRSSEAGVGAGGLHVDRTELVSRTPPQQDHGTET